MPRAIPTRKFVGAPAADSASGVPLPRWRAALLFGIALPALVGVAGCGREGIEHYRVERIAAAKPAEKTPQRMLGAVIPHGNRTWFFKLTGPPDVVADEKERFDAFVKSVRFDAAAGEPITWTAPESWHQESGSGMRYATFHIGEGDRAIELSVTPLSGASGGLLGNINRWRGQIGLAPISEDELPALTTELELGSGTATLVDMEGVGGGGSTPPMAAPFAAVGEAGQPHGVAPIATSQPELRYTTPEGWVDESGGGGGFRVAELRVGEGKEQALVTVIPLGAESGSLLGNVNRWRGQIGLAPIDESALEPLVQRIEIAGSDAVYIALEGPESEGPGRQAMLTATLPHGGRTWYFKMVGPADVVEAQEPAFKAFLRSVQFD